MILITIYSKMSEMYDVHAGETTTLLPCAGLEGVIALYSCVEQS